MLLLSGTVYLKTFAILYLRRHLGLPIYHTQQMITYSLSPHLSFTSNLRLISSSNHSRLSLLAPLHSRFSGPHNLAVFSFHITIIITVSLISSHFIRYTACYCLTVSENKPPSGFHSCLIDFYRHSKSPYSALLLFSHLISSYVNIVCHSHFILRGNRYRCRYWWGLRLHWEVGTRAPVTPHCGFGRSPSLVSKNPSFESCRADLPSFVFACTNGESNKNNLGLFGKHVSTSFRNFKTVQYGSPPTPLNGRDK